MHTDETAEITSRAFCTVVTFDHLAYALALHYSITRFHAIDLYVLIADRNLTELQQEETIRSLPSTIHALPYDHLFQEEMGKKIFDKYWSSDMDCYRWSMKSVLLIHLLKTIKIRRIIYADCDVHFFDDFNFLFDYLEDHSILLTPHWRSHDPDIDIGNFNLLFVGGLYNGGFVACNLEAVPALDWWSKVCLHKCVKDFHSGHYVDQTYLNLFPVYFDKVKTLNHQGCNVANWNQVVCKRTNKGNITLINEKWPIVFIHFTNSTIRAIHHGADHLLKPFLDEYLSILTKFMNTNARNIIEAASRPTKRPKISKAKRWLRMIGLGS